jgi:hypothetical protein
MDETSLPAVDWAPFDKYSRNEIECRCGAHYHSHSKTVIVDSKMTIVTRQPCPSCSKTFGHVLAARSGPEFVRLSQKDVGVI